MKVAQGTTRIVFVTKHYAFKIPHLLNGWELFLHGLLANIQEKTFSDAKFDGLCPVKFYIWGGFLVVMPKARVFTEDDFKEFDFLEFCYRAEYVIPAEYKHTSFGYWNHRVVAIDYG